jgi:C-5 cytosine-specific DNA methylase
MTAGNWPSAPLKVLDLFCGLKGWSAPFAERGHEVVSVDIEGRFDPTICEDVLELGPRAFGSFDVILASPPCEAFSVASIGHHWTGGMRAYEPRTDHARMSLALVHHTAALIEAIRPAVAVIENPRGMLRKLGVLDRYERVTVTFCQYGETRMKPTDLWGAPFPASWEPRPMCRNGATCHEAAPRGAKTGTQGIAGAAGRAEIPRDLAESICLAIEADIGRAA